MSRVSRVGVNARAEFQRWVVPGTLQNHPGHPGHPGHAGGFSSGKTVHGGPSSPWTTLDTMMIKPFFPLSFHLFPCFRVCVRGGAARASECLSVVDGFHGRNWAFPPLANGLPNRRRREAMRSSARRVRRMSRLSQTHAPARDLINRVGGSLPRDKRDKRDKALFYRRGHYVTLQTARRDRA